MHSLERELKALWPPQRWLDTRLLVAISGGADSVALLRAIVNLVRAESGAVEGRILAAHYNHGWRGAASDGDEEFVRQLCQRLQVPLIVGADTSRCDHVLPRSTTEIASRSDSGIREIGAPLSEPQTSAGRTEAGARQLRYDFLMRAAYACAARYVLTAHTASDRVETMLHNLLRGTGLAGVVGPPLTRPLGAELVVVRPLLGCWRGQVEAYLQDLGQDFRQDASNADVAFQRNYLRHKLLPDLRQRFGEKLDQRLLDFSELAEEVVSDQRQLAAEYVSRVAGLREEAAIELAGRYAAGQDGIYVPSLSKLNAPWSVVHQGLVRMWHERGWPQQSMSRSQWLRLRRLMGSAATGESENLPGNFTAVRDGEWVVIASNESRR